MFPASSLLIHYNAEQRRLWLAGQRCHHGAGGVLLTGLAVGVIAARLRVRGVTALLATGSVLMAHDWHDRSLWFSRGWQDQPWAPKRLVD